MKTCSQDVRVLAGGEVRLTDCLRHQFQAGGNCGNCLRQSPTSNHPAMSMGTPQRASWTDNVLKQTLKLQHKSSEHLRFPFGDKVRHNQKICSPRHTSVKRRHRKSNRPRVVAIETKNVRWKRSSRHQPEVANAGRRGVVACEIPYESSTGAIAAFPPRSTSGMRPRRQTTASS